MKKFGVIVCADDLMPKDGKISEAFNQACVRRTRAVAKDIKAVFKKARTKQCPQVENTLEQLSMILVSCTQAQANQIAKLPHVKMVFESRKIYAM